MTIVTGFNNDVFAAWTITDPNMESDSWLEENDMFLDGKAWNSLPPELDDPELHTAIDDITYINSIYVARFMSRNGVDGYFLSQREYDEMRSKCDSIISMLKELRNTTGLDFQIWNRLTSDIESRLSITNATRVSNGLDPFKSVED